MISSAPICSVRIHEFAVMSYYEGTVLVTVCTKVSGSGNCYWNSKYRATLAFEADADEEHSVSCGIP